MNEFLVKMVQLESAPPNQVQTLPDVQHDAKEIFIVKQKFTQSISQRLHKDVQKVDVYQLGKGLEMRSVEITSWKSTTDRIIQEQRLLPLKNVHNY